MFNILEHGISDFNVRGARVLDLFAGTGALGIEALSRGALSCLFVEDAPDARGLIRQNIEAFGLTGVTRIYRRDATDLGDAGNRDPFDLVFLDPPYGRGLGEKAIASAAAGRWLAPGAVIILEERADVTINWPTGLTQLDARAYGDTRVFFTRLDGEAARGTDGS
jgi:16S rRNA (guanine966-N2)-methyltransferase